MLIGCSIYSWAIIIEKFRLFKKINLESDEFEQKFWKSKAAETFYNNLPANLENPMGLLFKESMKTLLKAKSK
jgi:biopolymer transport protein TolQ